MDGMEGFKSVLEKLKKRPEASQAHTIEKDFIDTKTDHGASPAEDIKDEQPAEDIKDEMSTRPPPKVELVLQTEWSNLRKPEDYSTFTLPVQNVLMTHTGTKSCNSRSECVTVLKQLQRHHIAFGFNDILYNFMVGGDGRVYEGRGWERMSAEIPKYPESEGQCVKIALIGYYGDFSKKDVPSEMLKVLYDFLETGMYEDYIPYNASMIQDFNFKECAV